MGKRITISVETASGDEAIALCKSGTRIDIVFTDINLVGSAGGWDAAECFQMDRPSVGKRGLLNFRFAPKATELLRRREMT